MSLSGGTLSSGTYSGSSQGTHGYDGSEADMGLQARMELKRKRRMESNRESAKRSRQRKQQHLDDLTSQVDQLRAKNQQLVTALNVTVQNYAAAESQNSVLRTQMMELQNRLCTLRDMIYYMNANQYTNAATITTNPATIVSATSNYNPFAASVWNSGIQMVHQPIDQLRYQCF